MSAFRPHAFARTDRSRLGVWWWTIDHLLLGATAILIVLGVILSFGSSPAAVARIGLSDPFHFAWRQCLYAGVGAMILLAVSVCTPRGIRRVAFVVYIAAILIMGTAGTVMLREGLSAGSFGEIVIGSIGRLTIGEVVLAWVFTISYTAVGWWAPMALALVTLVLWPVDTEGPDALTHLPRLRRFEAFLDGAIGRTRLGLARGGVLVAIDLDNFGPINKDPRFGQAIGDEVLAEIGRRLRSKARTGDAVARPGGDEFAGFFAGSFDPESAIRLGVRLLDEIKRPVVTSAGILEVGGSIGLVIVVPGPNLPDNATLMRIADKTMQEVKRDGGGVRLFDPNSHPGGWSG